MLDEQATMKRRVQKILTPAQYEKWEQMKQDKKNQYNHKKPCFFFFYFFER